jgi:hypothetical protein
VRGQSVGTFGSICLLSIADPAPGEKSLFNYTAGNPEPDYAVKFGEGDLVRLPACGCKGATSRSWKQPEARKER